MGAVILNLGRKIGELVLNFSFHTGIMVSGIANQKLIPHYTNVNIFH